MKLRRLVRVVWSRFISKCGSFAKGALVSRRQELGPALLPRSPLPSGVVTVDSPTVIVGVLNGINWPSTHRTPRRTPLGGGRGIVPTRHSPAVGEMLFSRECRISAGVGNNWLPDPAALARSLTIQVHLDCCRDGGEP